MSSYLNYDEATGNITDKNGLNVASWLGAVPVPVKIKNKNSNLKKALALRSSGFSPAEVLEFLEIDDEM